MLVSSCTPKGWTANLESATLTILQDPAIVELDEKCKGFSMLVSQLDRLAKSVAPCLAGSSCLEGFRHWDPR